MRSTCGRAHRTIRQEGLAIRAIVAVFIAVALAGCGSPGKDKADQDKGGKVLTQNVLVPGALVTRWSTADPKHPRRRQWTVKWEDADLTFSEDGSFSGTLQRAKGDLFKDDEPASKFQAARGIADKGSSVLKLEGGVTVESQNPKGKLTCDEVRWDPDREVIEAKGNVRLDTPDYAFGPVKELWISPKLNVAGTPDLYEKKYGKKP